MLWGCCCFAANIFYCLRLPIQSNARGRWPKYYAWNVKSCGFDAASQQTLLLSPAPHPIQCLGEVTKILRVECKVLLVWCCFAANLYYCLWLPIQSNARRRWPKYFALNVNCCGPVLLRSKLILLSSAPNPKQCKGEVTKILFMECKVLWGCCCFAANLFHCLRLPIQFNARGRWPKYYAWNVKCCGFDAASQQTYFIVSGSPSNSMLGGSDQNTMLEM